MKNFMMSGASTPSNESSSKSLTRIKSEVAARKKKLGVNAAGTDCKQGVFDTFCKRCKREERPGSIRTTATIAFQTSGGEEKEEL